MVRAVFYKLIQPFENFPGGREGGVHSYIGKPKKTLPSSLNHKNNQGKYSPETA
jgi:hypothetical protein